MLDEHDSGTLERLWRSFFKKYTQMLKLRGGGDFEVEHAGSDQRQERVELVRAVGTDEDTYEAALVWWMDEEEDSTDE